MNITLAALLTVLIGSFCMILKNSHNKDANNDKISLDIDKDDIFFVS